MFFIFERFCPSREGISIKRENDEKNVGQNCNQTPLLFIAFMYSSADVSGKSHLTPLHMDVECRRQSKLSIKKKKKKTC